MSDVLIPGVISIATMIGTIVCALTAFNARTTLQRVGPLLLAGPLLVVSLFFSYNVFTLPDDIESLWFVSHLHAGMTRAGVDALQRSTRGTPTNRGGLGPMERCAEPAECVTYAANAYICFVTSTVFWIDFDRKQRVRSWKRGTWSDGC